MFAQGKTRNLHAVLISIFWEYLEVRKPTDTMSCGSVDIFEDHEYF